MVNASFVHNINKIRKKRCIAAYFDENNAQLILKCDDISDLKILFWLLFTIMTKTSENGCQV